MHGITVKFEQPRQCGSFDNIFRRRGLPLSKFYVALTKRPMVSSLRPDSSAPVIENYCRPWKTVVLAIDRAILLLGL